MAQLSAGAARMSLFYVSCLLLGCLMWFGEGRWQHPFIQAPTPAQRSTGTFCSSFAAGLPGRQLPCNAEPPVRGSRLVWLPCLALLGPLASSRCGVPCFVRERLQGTATPRRRQGGVKSKANDPRILTSKIKKAETAAELLRVLDGAVDGEIFNHIHASAACTSLAALNGKGVQAADAKNPVILRLASRIEVLIEANEMNPQALANVLWAFAKMFVTVPAVLGTMPALLRGVTAKAKGMNPQELSNSLWAAAQLQGVRPEVLDMVPALVAQIPSQVGDMKPQHLSNIMLASAKLQDVAPAVLGVLPAIAAEIPGKAREMIPQALSNSLWATAKLQDAAPEVLSVVSALAKEIPNKAGDMNPQELSNAIWAAAQLQDKVPEVLQVVPAVAAEIPAKVDNMKPQEVSNSLFAAMRLEDAVPEVVEVVPALVKEVPGRMCSMRSQELANSLEALVVLEERLPIVGLPRIAAAAAVRLKGILQEVNGKDFVFAVPVIVWACAKLEVCDSQLLAAVAEQFLSMSIKSSPPRSLCALAWT